MAGLSIAGQEQFTALLGRLDSRYKHILLSMNFKMQSATVGIVRSWLDTYGDDHQRQPCSWLEITKQSIYRFQTRLIHVIFYCGPRDVGGAGRAYFEDKSNASQCA